MKKFTAIVIMLLASLFLISGCQIEIISQNETGTTGSGYTPKSEEPKKDDREQNTDTDSGTTKDEDKDTNSGNQDKDATSGDDQKDDGSEQKDDPVISENNAFKIVSPTQNQVINNSFIIKGKARVFEANFQYRLEDGHNVLAEGFITANEGAPAWGDFEKEVSFDGATSPSAVLIIFEASAKDGSPQHELIIPLKLEHYE